MIIATIPAQHLSPYASQHSSCIPPTSIDSIPATDASCFCCLVTQLCLTLLWSWTVACQSLLSMGFLRQEYWSALPFLIPGDLPDPGIEPASPALAGGFFPTEP